MAESTGLENRQSRKRLVSSNLTLSAIMKNPVPLEGVRDFLYRTERVQWTNE